MHAKPGALVLRDDVTEAFIAYYGSRTASRLAELIGRSVSTVTRDRGSFLDRYTSVELSEFLIDDLRGDSVLVGGLIAIALGGKSDLRDGWLLRELGGAVQEMMNACSASVGAIADGRLTESERKQQVKVLRPLLGQLAVLVLKLERGEP